MNYCINYQKQFKYYNMDIVSEINFQYEDNFIIVLMEFLEENEVFRTKKLNICFEEISDLKNFCTKDNINAAAAIKQKYPNIEIKIRLPFLSELSLYTEEIMDIIKLLKDNKIKFFTRNYIKTWDELYGWLKQGVSDVYITEDMGFELRNVSNLVHSYDAQVRVFPNVAQSSWENSPDLKKFFLRPEDIPLCEDYIDVLEFWNYQDKINTLFEIYAIDKEWKDQIGFIIQSFSLDLDSRHLIPDFILSRLSCGKICIKGKHCTLCERCIDLARVLEDKGYIIDYTQSDEDIEDEEDIENF